MIDWLVISNVTPSTLLFLEKTDLNFMFIDLPSAMEFYNKEKAKGKKNLSLHKRTTTIEYEELDPVSGEIS